MLTPGADQTLSALFTPTDAADYTTATGTTTINVTKTELAITWSAPAEITYGTLLSGTQLDATANIPGKFTYQPAAGTLLAAGSGQTLSAAFTPADLTDYASTPASTTIDVAKATPVLKLSDPGGEFDGAAFGASVTIAGVANDSAPSASLEGVAPTLTYYSGTGTTGPHLGTTARGSGRLHGRRELRRFGRLRGSSVGPGHILDHGGHRCDWPVRVDQLVGLWRAGNAGARVSSSVTPDGTVTFYDGSDALGTLPVDGSGAAVLTTSALSAGPNVTAVVQWRCKFARRDVRSGQ